jgi:hypothetical protein
LCKGISIEEKAAIFGYTDDEYLSLNSYLRGLNVSTEKSIYFDNYRNLLNNALDEISVKFKGTSYRGTSLPEKTILKYEEAFKTKQPYVEDAFFSSSSDITRQFSGNTRFIIDSKTERSVESVSYHDRLYRAGTKFQVTSLNRRPDGVTIIHLEEL